MQMGKIAFVFSGQGGQYSGMGKSLAEASDAAKEVFEISNSIRPGTSEQCFSGSDEELKETKNTQPCIYTVDLAAAEALRASGVKADMLAGFSLGEIAALTYSGAVIPEAGFDLVCKRGRLMQVAGEKNPGVMAAILKLDREAIESLAKGYRNIFPVNYNCPGQIVVSGKEEEIESFKASVKQAGGRAMQLKVGGSFHCPFMSEAADGFKAILDEVDTAEPECVIYSNRTGRPYEGDIKELLYEQIKSPVLWQDTIEHMIASGADTFIEVGPGKTLCGLISKISGDVSTYNVEDAQSLDATLKGLGIC